MNRAALAAAAIRESLEAAVEAEAPPAPEPSEVAYDLPGDRTVMWADLAAEPA